MIKFKLSVCEGSFLTVWRGLLLLLVLVPMLPAAEVDERIEDGCLAVADTGREWTNVHLWP